MRRSEAGHKAGWDTPWSHSPLPGHTGHMCSTLAPGTPGVSSSDPDQLLPLCPLGTWQQQESKEISHVLIFIVNQP